MRRLREKLRCFMIMIAVLMWLVSCNTFDSSVPEYVPELRSSLSGFLLMECLDAKPTICKLDFDRDYNVSPIIPNCEGRCFEASLSVDGTHLLYTEDSYSGDKIWLFNLDSQSLRLLVQGEDPKLFLGWSPKADKIAYVILRDMHILSKDEIETVMKNPNAPPEPVPIYRHSTLHIFNLVDESEIRLTSLKGDVSAYDWSPNGEQIVISARLEDLNKDGEIDSDDPARLYLFTLSDQTLEPFSPLGLSRAQMFAPSWSFDGRYIAYVTDTGHLVIVSTLTGNEVTRFQIGAGRNYQWAPNELKIAYIGASIPEDSVVAFCDLFVFDLTTGKHKRLTNTSTQTMFACWEQNGIQLNDLLWSPDSKYIALGWQTKGKRHLVVSSADGAQLTWVTEFDYYRFVGWGQ